MEQSNCFSLPVRNRNAHTYLDAVQSRFSTEEVQFVDQLDEKYSCISCQNMLRPPVLQALCGHRICGSCAHRLLEYEIEVDCPGNEEDCVRISNNKLCPDRATEKEILRQKIYCTNRSHGCDFTCEWRHLKSHIDSSCPFQRITCPNSGCLAELFCAELEAHRSKCKYKPVLCEYCYKDISWNDMEDGHILQCLSTTKKCKYHKFGCTYTGTFEEMQEHIKEATPFHVDMINNEIEQLQVAGKTNSEDIKQLRAVMSENFKVLKDEKNNLADNLLDKVLSEVGDNLVAIKVNADGHLSDAEKKKMEGMLTRIENLERKKESMKNTIHMHEIRLSEADLRSYIIEQTKYNGCLVWKINNYRRRKEDALSRHTLSLHSVPFFTSSSGYKMCARVYLNGDGIGKGTHLSLFFQIMRGEFDALMSWPFRQCVTLTLLDQSGNRKHITDTFIPDPTSSSFLRPRGEMNIASGSPLFAQQSKVEAAPFLKNDTIFIRVMVDTVNMPDPLG